jgi:hypothetical protein
MTPSKCNVLYVWIASPCSRWRIDADAVEREIVERIKAAKLVLRFDKVAVRLVGRLKAALADGVPQAQAVVFAVAAPIRLPAKTAAALQTLAHDCPPGSERRALLHGNSVCLRRLTGVPPHRPKTLGFVHNPASDPALILDLAAARLRERQGEGRDD